ncbi:MAG: pentapeptide repeat-containing protein [Heteroscytonema crispum UTEX LB 1556]
MNVEQVNAAVGMNVFLLLCSFHRQIKIPFAACGNPANLAEFNPEAVITLIARTAVLSKNAFATRMRFKFLPYLNLSRAYLRQVMLCGANLRQINLSNADLRKRI